MCLLVLFVFFVVAFGFLIIVHAGVMFCLPSDGPYFKVKNIPQELYIVQVVSQRQ
jgi:hypothetical protein